MQTYPIPGQQYGGGQPGQQHQQQRLYAGQAIQPTMPTSANIPVAQQLQAGQGRGMLNAQQQHQFLQQQQQQQQRQQGIPMQTAAFKRSIGAVDTSIALTTAEVIRQHKRRKPTDRTLPPLSHDEGLDKLKKEYERLLDLERTLDVTYTRKKAELQDDLTSVRKTVWKRLRIRIHNECADQEWQREGGPKVQPDDGESANNDKPDIETGKGVPSWTVHIEGAVLDLEGISAGSANSNDVQPRFSHIVQHLSIDLQRAEGSYREPGVLNWQPVPNATPVDGFSFTRSGTEPVPIRVSLYCAQHPKRFRVAPELGNLLNLREESKLSILVALWAYIQRERLLESSSSAPDSDRRNIRCDGKLQRLFGRPKMQFHEMSEAVNRYLSNIEPVVLEYTVNISPKCVVHSSTYDILLELPDPSIRSAHAMLRALAPNTPASQDILKIDESIASTTASIRNLAHQHSLLTNFSKNPATFMQDWLRSQSLDLQDLLDPDPSKHQGVDGEWRLERLRDAEWFKQDWITDAVSVHIARAQANPKA